MESSTDQLNGLQRSLIILKALARNSESGVSVRKIAADTGISRSTVHRILTNLHSEDMATLLPGGRYGVGPALWELAASLLSGSPVLNTADRIMRSVARQFDESVYFAMLLAGKNEVVFVHVVESSRALRYVLPLGWSTTLYAGASGKAILAHLPASTIDALPLKNFTDSTVTDRDALESELEKIRREGYAVSIGERREGAVGIGAAVLSGGHPIGAITVTIPATRFDAGLVGVIGPCVANAAREVTTSMAGRSFVS